MKWKHSFYHIKHCVFIQEPGQQQGQWELSSPVADSAAEEETYPCKMPFAFYCYMNHTYKEKIERIEAENGVKIVAQVKIEPHKENGDPRKALSEFRNLVQTSFTECGPGQSQDAISKSLNTIIQKTLTNTKPSVGEPTRSSYETPQTIGQGQVNFKAHSRRSEQNKLMESHAVRGLLPLYQRVGTSPLWLTKRYGVSGFNGSLKTNDYQQGGASGGAVSNGLPGYSRGNTEEPTGGTVAVREEDATCPICMDKFTDKIQLKCGHQFCKGCLQKAKMTTGPICPVCRDVFDVVEGDQPPGNMSVRKNGSALDGFPQCGTIVISYEIPGGRQTVNTFIWMSWFWMHVC